MRNIILIVFLLIICSKVVQGQAADDHRLNVVASNSIVADLVRNVAGDRIILRVLVGANGDPHVYEPTPQDNIAIYKADLIFENGLLLEPWMDKLMNSSGTRAGRVIVTRGVKLIDIGDDHHDEHGHDHGEFDPHVWHDVQNIRLMINVICQELIKADPKHAAVYERNAKSYDEKLLELDQWIVDQVALISPENRKLVTSHNTLGYFARRYGFQIVASIIDSATTEAADPSALRMAELIKEIKRAEVSVIFVENVTNLQLVKALAKEVKVKISPALFSDALGSEGSNAETYIDMMKSNVKVIVEALR